jgi:hypothetical protein
MRIAAAIFVAIHGVGHIIWFFSTWVQRALGEEGRLRLQAHRQDFLIDPKSTAGKTLRVLSLAVLIGFVVTGWGIWTESPWWQPLMIGSAVTSMIVIFSIWNPIKAPGPVPLSVRALLANIGLGAATLMPWGKRLLGTH